MACAPLRQCSGGEVGVFQTPRWNTEMESDSCQEGSGLTGPLRWKSGGGEECTTTGCLCLLPSGLTLI